MVNRRPAADLRGTFTWLYVRGECLMTILNFWGGACVGGEAPSYHCAGLLLVSSGVKPSPRTMRLKSRRFIWPSYLVKAFPTLGKQVRFSSQVTIAQQATTCSR